MMDKGHTSLTGKDLVFFSHLDCGITQASAVARRMGVTRQAVYKSTKHLQIIGALELAADPDDQRQKVISMTPMGEKIALDARASLAEIEGYLASTVGGASLKQLKATLAQNWVSMDTRCTDNSLGAKSAPK